MAADGKGRDQKHARNQPSGRQSAGDAREKRQQERAGGLQSGGKSRWSAKYRLQGRRAEIAAQPHEKDKDTPTRCNECHG